MVELALMVAIIFVMAFTPLGYFRTPALSITFLTVPVSIGAMMLGPTGGAICGFAFGLSSFIQNFTTPFGMALITINPLATFITCVGARVLDGFLCGVIARKIKPRSESASRLVVSLSCPILNTVFFMSLLVLFFYNSDYIQGFVSTLGVANPFSFILAFVGVQGVIEAIVCFLISSTISRPLERALRGKIAVK